MSHLRGNGQVGTKGLGAGKFFPFSGHMERIFRAFRCVLECLYGETVPRRSRPASDCRTAVSHQLELNKRAATCHRHSRASNIARFIGCEHHIGRRQFTRLCGPTDRRIVAKVLHDFRWHGRRNERRPYRAGRNAVHPDVLVSQHLRKPILKFCIAPLMVAYCLLLFGIRRSRIVRHVSSFRLRSDALPPVWPAVVRPISLLPSVPSCVSASGRAARRDRRRSCGTGRTCLPMASLLHGHGV